MKLADFLYNLFSGRSQSLPINALFSLQDLYPVLQPAQFFTEKDILTGGGAVQCMSKVHQAMAYANYNLKQICQNATVIRSNGGLPDSIDSSEDCSAAVTQALTDSHTRSGSFMEAGVALGSVIWEAEAKMKKINRALQGKRDFYLEFCHS